MKSIRPTIVCLMLCLSLTEAIGSVSVDVPYTFVLTAENSRYIFVMDEREVGACYVARNAGKLERLWETSHWYAFPEELFLTPNGESLIRVWPLAATEEDREKKPFIQFYLLGKLIKQYTPRDLQLDRHEIEEHGRDAQIVTARELARILLLEDNARKIVDRSETLWATYLLVETPHTRFVFEPSTGKILVREELKNSDQEPDK